MGSIAQLPWKSQRVFSDTRNLGAPALGAREKHVQKDLAKLRLKTLLKGPFEVLEWFSRAYRGGGDGRK